MVVSWEHTYVNIHHAVSIFTACMLDYSKKKLCKNLRSSPLSKCSFVLWPSFLPLFLLHSPFQQPWPSCSSSNTLLPQDLCTCSSSTWKAFPPDTPLLLSYFNQVSAQVSPKTLFFKDQSKIAGTTLIPQNILLSITYFISCREQCHMTFRSPLLEQSLHVSRDFSCLGHCFIPILSMIPTTW